MGKEEWMGLEREWGEGVRRWMMKTCMSRLYTVYIGWQNEFYRVYCQSVLDVHVQILQIG